MKKLRQVTLRLAVVPVLALVGGCSTPMRDMATKVFHPKTTTDWVLLPITAPSVIVMEPVVDPICTFFELSPEEQETFIHGGMDAYRESRDAGSGGRQDSSGSGGQSQFEPERQIPSSPSPQIRPPNRPLPPKEPEPPRKPKPDPVEKTKPN